MSMIPSHSISLENFEGPLDLLLYLIQKNEIDIYDIRIQIITQQFLDAIDSFVQSRVDVGAEFLGITSTLLLIKSQKLLPKTSDSIELIEEDPRFTLLQQLLEYCRFKEIAKDLNSREEKQNLFYPRGLVLDAEPSEQPHSTLAVSLSELSILLQEIIKRQGDRISTVIKDEEWSVADKIVWIRQEIALSKTISFDKLFLPQKTKDEWIVIFLAILELMKSDAVSVTKEGIISK